MEVADDIYTIALHPGETQYDLYENITEVVDEFATNDQIFVARLSEAQLNLLRNDDRVIGVDNMAEMVIEEDADNTLPANRTRAGRNSINQNVFPYAPATNPIGNWALKRHMSPTNNFAEEDTNYPMGFSYPQHGGVDVDGTGVDIVACIGHVPDITNDGYKTNGVSRIQQFQWNTLPGLTDKATIDYNTPESSPLGRSHAETVLAMACHNTYGWAKGARIYIMPRSWESNAYWWEAVRLFHKSKVDAGNVRPTIWVSSFGYSYGSHVFGFNNIHFRGSDYNTHRGLSGLSSVGQYAGWDNFGMPISLRRSHYTTIKTLATNMENEGVFNVVTPGNKNQKNDLPGGIDYDNHVWGAYETSQPNPPNYACRETALAGPNTIIVGNMQSAFNSIVPGKETLWATSNKGPRIDCVMGATNLLMDRSTWGHIGESQRYYNATGTSFAAPQVAGILAMVLQKYPNTTQAQARKYFRDYAIGTDKLYDAPKPPISDGGDYGDPDYFTNLGLCGYSGNILYLDPAMSFDPSTITDTTITPSTETLTTSKINFTISEINAKLASIP